MRGFQGLAVALLFLGVACTPAQPAPQTGGPAQPAEQRSANQSLTIGQIGVAAAMTPEAGLPTSHYYGAMYDYLTLVGEKFDVRPAVAEKWEQTTATTWRFTIRKGLTFSNGDPLSAADVEFTGKLMIDAKMPAIGQFANLVEVRQAGADTVEFVTKIPDASVLPAAAALAIMPKKYYESVGKSGFAAKPIGSGPYEIVEFRSADMVSFKKRTTEHPFRKPIAERLTFRSIPEASQMVAGMRTGELDILVGTISPDLVDSVKASGAVIQSKASGMITGLYSQPENRERNTPLTDRRVRLALNYAVDKDAMTKQLLRGYAQPIGQLSVPDSPSWDPSVQPFPYDPAMAKRLLAEAGYPNGFKLPVGIEFTPFNNDASIGQAIQGYLRDVGVETAVTSYEFGQFLDKYYGRNGQSKGDIFLTSAGENNGFGTFLYSNYTCSKTPHWWCNPEFDRNMEAAVGESDREKRGALMRRAAAAMREDVALLFLYFPQTYVILQPKVKGFVWDLRTFNFDAAYRVD